MNETDLSRENRCVMCEDGQGPIGTGCRERDDCGIRYFTQQRVGEYIQGGCSGTLMARDYKSASDLVVHIQNSSLDGVTETLDASYYKGPGARNGKEREFLAMEIEPVVYPGVGITSPQNASNPQPNDPAPSLTNDSRNYLVTDGKPQRKYIVRRLTPTECAALQGMPRDWCEWLGGSDSAKYKAYGNGLALPCAYDVLNRIARFVEWENANDNLSCNNHKESQEIP